MSTKIDIVYTILKRYSNLEDFPERTRVRRGDILKPNLIVNSYPLLQGTNIFLLGYMSKEDTAIGICIQEEQFKAVRWNPLSRLEEDLTKDFWTIKKQPNGIFGYLGEQFNISPNRLFMIELAMNISRN